jgi:hypothetical protein
MRPLAITVTSRGAICVFSAAEIAMPNALRMSGGGERPEVQQRPERFTKSQLR